MILTLFTIIGIYWHLIKWTRDLEAKLVLVPDRQHLNQKTFPEIQPLIDKAAKKFFA